MGPENNDFRFYAGDTVVVRGVRDCVFGYNDDMEDLIGHTVHITSVEMDKTYDELSYSIIEDGGSWMWDDSCFEYIESDNFEPVSADELKEFILK